VKKNKLSVLFVVLLVLSLSITFIGNEFGQNLFELDFFTMWGVTLLVFILALSAKPEQTEWICQNCQAKLVRKEIKFGSCPHCGEKVKGFRGESPYSWI